MWRYWHLALAVIAAVFVAKFTFVDNTFLLGRYIFHMMVPAPGDSMSWTEYHRLDTIHKWMHDLERKYPDCVKIKTIGQSVEKRALKLAKIGCRHLCFISKLSN